MFRRIKNPNIIVKIKSNFTGDGLYNQDAIANELYRVMLSEPRKIFVVCNFDIHRNINGFLVAWVEDGRDHVWLSQAWSSPQQINRESGKEAIEMIKQWARDEHNLHEIRFETERNPDAIARVWGFETHAYIMKCKF